MPSETHAPVIAIIGGGFTGAAVARELDRRLPQPGAARIVVVEPRATLGAGLAYATDDPACRINVPSRRMSIDPGEPDQFEDWLVRSGEAAADPDSLLLDGRRFPRRAAFGRYVAEALAPSLAAGRIIHRRALAMRVDAAGQGYRLQLSDRTTIEADLLVIASTHPPPAVPPVFATALQGDPRLIRDATRPGALGPVAADERVLVVGTGLTMADVVASLDAAGHRGPVTAFSRRGQLSASHPPFTVQPFGDFTRGPSASASALVRRIRAVVREAERQGIATQAVFDALRAQGRAIWRALPLPERRRVVRHLRVFWDARRFRIAPQVHDVLEARKARGLFTVLAGRAVEACGREAEITVTIAPRSGRNPVRLACDRVIIATGPAHGGLLENVPYLAALAGAGLVTPDDVGLGLATDTHGRAIGRDGSVRDTLLVGGPLARGTFGELMGLPEVAQYAIEIAQEISNWIENRRQLRGIARRSA